MKNSSSKATRINNILYLLISLPLWLSCGESPNRPDNLQKDNSKIIEMRPHLKRSLVVTPLGSTSPIYIQWAAKALNETYKMPVIVENSIPNRPDHHYTQEGKENKVNASKILNEFKSTKVIPVFITEADIAIDKKLKNGKQLIAYGIIGLGKQPIVLTRMSNSCAIVSTYRIKKIKSIETTRVRLQKAVVHEVGHNLSLPHCNNQRCVMVDAKGKVSNIDNAKKSFCKNCTNTIKEYLK